MLVYTTLTIGLLKMWYWYFQTRHLANQKMKINTQYFLNVALKMLSGIKSAKLLRRAYIKAQSFKKL